MRYSAPQSQPSPLLPTIREVDYVAYLHDEYLKEMNSTFEVEFTKDVLAKFKSGKIGGLSQKQEICLRRMVDKYMVAEDYQFCKRGYADSPTVVKQVSGKDAAANQGDDVEDRDEL